MEKRTIKNRTKWTTILFAFIVLLSACSEDFFNEQPSDRIVPEQHYNSGKEAELSTLSNVAILMDVVPQLVINNELMGELTTTTDNADFFLKEIGLHNLSADNPYLDPSGFYKVIVNVNESLLYIDSITSKDNDFKEIDLMIMKGNMIGIRSWAYFTLARLYGEVAYLKDNMPYYDEDKLVYMPREEILDTLVNQLQPYLEIDYVDVENIAMYNKALIGDIYLEMNDYQNAITHLQMAIEGFENTEDMYKVTSSFSRRNWMQMFVNSSSQRSEVMFAVEYHYLTNRPNPLEMWFGYDYDYLVKPSSVSIDYFENIDDGGDRYRGDEISYLFVDEEEEIPTIYKYNHNEANPLSSDIILYRAADIHLMLAEAMNRAGQYDAALALLNEGYHEFTNWGDGIGVRGRVNLDPREVPEGADKMKTIEDFIMEERACELAYEGKRWFDLMRVARRRGASYLADKVASKFADSKTANAVKDKLKNEENWYIPMRK